MTKSHNKFIKWLNKFLFNQNEGSNEKVDNPYKNIGFKTIYPDNYKPFTKWTEEERLELYQQFKKIR